MFLPCNTCCFPSLAFSETPRNRSARFGEEVDFRCSFPGATNIVWKVNDQLLNEIEDLKYNLDKENIVSILTITALKSYRIKCVAEFPSQTIRSQPAYLTVITSKCSVVCCVYILVKKNATCSRKSMSSSTGIIYFTLLLYWYIKSEC